MDKDKAGGTLGSPMGCHAMNTTGLNKSVRAICLRAGVDTKRLTGNKNSNGANMHGLRKFCQNKLEDGRKCALFAFLVAIYDLGHPTHT